MPRSRSCDVTGAMEARARVSVLDPVDVVTGEVFETRTDFTLPGPIPLAWTTYYSNQLGVSGPLGHNWTHQYHSALEFRADAAVFLTGLGSEVLFPELPAAGKPAISADGRFVLEQRDSATFGVGLPNGLTRTFWFGDGTRRAVLQAVVDRNGHRIEFLYDRPERLTRIRDSAGRTLELTCDDEARIASISCFRGNEPPGTITLVTYAYDGRGDLVAVTDTAGAARRYAYDAYHQLVRRTDRNDYSFHYEYDGARCRRTRGDDGLYFGEFTYDLERRRTIVHGFDGRETEYQYDDRARVVKEIDPLGNATETAYDPLGNVAVRTDRVGRATVWKYDDRSRLLEETRATGQRIVNTYDADGNLVAREDSTSGVSRFEHDERGNVTAEIGPATSVERRYDRFGRVRWTKSNGALPETSEYDAYHQLVAIRGATGGIVVAYSYDLLGNIVASTDRRGRIAYDYDAMSRIIRVRYPDGTFEESEFDAEGNPTRWRERFASVWHYGFQARKQLASVTAPDGGVTRYEYTAADELAAVTDPAGNRTEYLYDQRDFVVAVRRNGVVFDRYDRDAEGRLVAKHDANGVELLRLEYAAASEPIARTYSRDGERVERKLSLDNRGRVVAASGGAGEVARVYHRTGVLATEQQGERGVAQELNDSGQIVRAEFDGGVEFRQHTVTDTRVIRDPLGRRHAQRLLGSRIAENVFASGIREQFAYDASGRLESHTIRRNGVILSRTTYRYDVNGQLLAERQASGEVQFVYDACRRLTAVRARGTSLPYRSETFAYDSAGNVRREGSGSGAFVRGNLLTGTADRAFEYDYRGRLASERGAHGRRQYRYDSIDQLVEVTEDGRITASYEYDALRRRVRKVTELGATSFGWNGSRLAWELRPDGSRRIYHYSDPSTHDPLFICDEHHDADGNQSLRIYAVHHDATHRPILITDDSGEVVWSATWSAYGDATVQTSRGFLYNLRLAGQYYDAETGLHYNYHRYYDPATARFIQPDLIGLAGGINLYEYSDGDPLRGCEVLGLTGT